MKGPPHSTSIRNAELRCAHVQAHARTAFIHQPPVAGLSDVSVISCPAWLNYVVNKSLLVSTCPLASRVWEQTHTQTHPSESVSCNSCLNLTPHLIDQRTNSAGTLHRTVHLQLCLKTNLSHSLIPTITPYFYFSNFSTKCNSCKLLRTTYKIISICHAGMFQRDN